MNRTALLVIDFQHGLIDQEPRATRGTETLAALNRLIALARRRGQPVIFVQHHDPEHLPRGSAAWQLHPGLDHRPGDPVVDKTCADAFVDTPLAALLEQLSVGQLWVGGYASDFCVDTTVRSAAARGYAVTVAADAHTSKDRPHAGGDTLVAHLNWLWPHLAVPGEPIRVRPVAELETDER